MAKLTNTRNFKGIMHIFAKNEAENGLTMANNIDWCQHVKRRKDDHILANISV